MSLVWWFADIRWWGEIQNKIKKKSVELGNGELTKCQMDWRPIECYQQAALWRCKPGMWEYNLNSEKLFLMNQQVVISLSSKGSPLASSKSYLFMLSFSNLHVSDVLGLVVDEEVKGLLTLVQPVSNLVRMLLNKFRESSWLRHWEPFSQLWTATKLLCSDILPVLWLNRRTDT